MTALSLSLKKDSLEAVADKALERGIGARGLRAVLENVMTDIMYDIPSDQTVEKVTVTKDCILNNSGPVVVTNPDKKRMPVRKPGKEQDSVGKRRISAS